MLASTSAHSSLLGYSAPLAMAASPNETDDDAAVDAISACLDYPHRAQHGAAKHHSHTQPPHSTTWLWLRLAAVLVLGVLVGVALTVSLLSSFASSGIALLRFPHSTSSISWHLLSSTLSSAVSSSQLASSSALLLSSPAASAPLPASLSTPAAPVLSRGAFLFLCATQAEASRYVIALPPVVADVYVYCWKEACTLDALYAARAAANLTARYDAHALYVSPYTSSPDATVTMRSNRRHTAFSRHTDLLVVPESDLDRASQAGAASSLSAYAVPGSYVTPASVVDDFWRVVPRVAVWNEADVMGGTNSSWNTARNFLLAKAQEYEALQGWRYAYLTFGDGDVKLMCDRFQSVVRTGQPLQAIHGTYSDPGRLDSYLPQFLHWWHITRHTSPPDAYSLVDGLEVTCWLGYFASLLTAAPAMGTFRNVYSPSYPDTPTVDADVAWSYDAILSSFHADAVPLFLPYCQRWDELSWWASQSVVAYRGVCVLGHALYINHVTVDPAYFTHQPYAKMVDPWVTVDQCQHEQHTVPSTLLGVQRHLEHNSTIGQISLADYGGWHSGLVSRECQTRQADPVSCVWVSK